MAIFGTPHPISLFELLLLNIYINCYTDEIDEKGTGSTLSNLLALMITLNQYWRRTMKGRDIKQINGYSGGGVSSKWWRHHGLVILGGRIDIRRKAASTKVGGRRAAVLLSAVAKMITVFGWTWLTRPFARRFDGAVCLSRARNKIALNDADLLTGETPLSPPLCLVLRDDCSHGWRWWPNDNIMLRGCCCWRRVIVTGHDMTSDVWWATTGAHRARI